MKASGRALRWAVAAVLAALLLGSAGVAAAWQVEVDDGGSTRACGSVLDAVTGRVGWQEWWAADATDPGQETALARTRDCPGALNRRLVLVGGLLAAAVIAGAAALVDRRASTPTPVTRSRQRPDVDRLRALGRRVATVGAALVVAGIAAIAMLLADPDATLFVYVDRPTVALLGALVVLPALALVAAGRAIELLAGSVATRGGIDAES